MGVGKSKEHGGGSKGQGVGGREKSREHEAEKDSYELRVPGYCAAFSP